MREAVAMPQRAELNCSSIAESVICGLRPDGSLSLYFGPDPVYQFDSHGLLRRAYVAGYLFRSDGLTLAKLRRDRTESQTLLVRTDLDQQSLKEFQDTMNEIMYRLLQDLQTDQYRVLKAVPDADSVVPVVQAALERIMEPRTTWLSSSIRARRI